MFLVHRGDVVEPVEVGQRLQVRFVFDQLLGSAVEQSDMRIDARNDFAVELEHEAQNAVGRWVLGPEIDGEIADSSFGHSGPKSTAGATPATPAGSETLATAEPPKKASPRHSARLAKPTRSKLPRSSKPGLSPEP